MIIKQINLPVKFIGLLILFIGSTSVYASGPFSAENLKTVNLTVQEASNETRLRFHDDSIHRIDFRYPDEKKGMRPWIAPGLLFAGGTALHLMPELKEEIHNHVGEKLVYNGNVDDYLQLAPLAAVYLLNFSGVKGKNNFGNSTAIALKSIFINSTVTTALKVWINAPRPNLAKHSFPSGHTSTAFTFAHFMHREFGEKSPWYSVGAYTSAAVVGLMRMGKNVHWLPDVLAGAGVGILSTEFVYLTHQYKWDNKHLKKLDVLPFQAGEQKGVSLLYTF